MSFYTPEEAVYVYRWPFFIGGEMTILHNIHSDFLV